MASKSELQIAGPGQRADLGNLVRFHRRKADLTQIQLAQLAGVGKSTVYDIEKGKLAIQHDKLLAILQVLNITVRFDSPLMATYEKSADTSV